MTTNKRFVFFIDSPLNSEFYYHICLNIPEDLVQDLLTLDSRLSSFETFYFLHKDNIQIEFCIVDRLYSAYLLQFANLFSIKEQRYYTLFHEIIDSIYISHSKEDNFRFVDNDMEIIMSYLDDIKKELLYRDDELVSSTLLAKCSDVSRMLIKSNDCSVLSQKEDSEITMISTSIQILYENIMKWGSDNKELDFIKNTYRKYDNELEFISLFNLESEELDLELLDKVGKNISKLLSLVIYDSRLPLNTVKNEILNLWSFMTSIQYRGVLPSSFYTIIKQLYLF